MAQVLLTLSQCLRPELVANTTGALDTVPVPLGPLPTWAEGYVDCRDRVPWNDS